jgi:hypothetical protein
MVLDSTTDNLYLSLSSNITTNQLNFYATHNIVTNTTLTPSKNQGTTNNTSLVQLIPSPSAGEQHQLRYCSIVNTDTKPNSILVQYSGSSNTAVILNTSLLPNESLQYTTNNGWQVYSNTGNLKVLGSYDLPNSLRNSMYLKPITTATTLTLVSGTDYAVYLGKSDRKYNTIRIQYSVTSSPSPITWSEIAIYKGSPTINGATTALNFCGFADVSSTVGTTGNKTTTITVTGITINDDLYAVFGSSHTGTYSLRACSADDLGAGFFSTVTGSLRPSTNATLTVTTDSTTSNIWCFWQGLQW